MRHVERLHKNDISNQQSYYYFCEIYQHVFIYFYYVFFRLDSLVAFAFCLFIYVADYKYILYCSMPLFYCIFIFFTVFFFHIAIQHFV